MRFLPKMALIALAAILMAGHAHAQQLACQPCNDHYGRVSVGTSVQRLIQLKNVGTKTLRIKAKAITGAAFAFGNFPVPVDLGAGKTIKLPVIFAPTTAGKNTGSITITSNAQNPKLTIDVSGVGVTAQKPHLTISPLSLDFGSVNVGSAVSLNITLSASVAPVTVSAIQSNSSEFTLPGLSLPLTVAVGSNIQVKVKFIPNASGIANAQLTLTSDADNSPGTVSLTGIGVAVGSHSADLSWDASQDPVIGYNVYRGNTKGGPYAQVNVVLNASTDYTDSNVQGGATYFYVVKAVDAQYQESAPSNEAKVVIPSP